VHSKKIGTVFSIGFIHGFLVISQLFYGNGGAKFPKSNGGQAKTVLNAVVIVCPDHVANFTINPNYRT
jgi:hypothetical protein